MMSPRSGPAWRDLERFEQRVYSQNGEDGVLGRLFELLGTSSRICVELGTEDGQVCNTRYLIENGWQGYLFDADPRGNPRVQQAWINANNVNQVLRRTGVPRQFDLLSIDLDGNDYWVWQALHYSPRVIVIEYNSSVPPDEARVIPYDPGFRWDHRSDYFGASLLALEQLGRRKGYALVHCESMGVNAFFVSYEFVDPSRMPNLQELYRPPRYGTHGRGHEPDRERPWLQLQGAANSDQETRGFGPQVARR